MNKVIVLLCLLFLWNTALAQEKDYQNITQKLVQLSQIEDSESRLSEYDLLAEEARFLIDRLKKDEPADKNAATESSGSKEVGKWETQIQTNPLDDSKTVAAILEADTGVNKFGKKPKIVAMCRSNTVNFYINWGEQLKRDNEVIYRMGQQDSKTELWVLSTDAQATFHPNETTVPFLKEFQQHKRFVAQTTPLNSAPITAIFDITGAENVISQVLSCGS